MRTTADIIKMWINRGIREGHEYMIVKCDTFDYDDYPVYCNADTYPEKSRCGEMQKIMEVYDLTIDIAPQLDEHRAFHPPKMKTDEHTEGHE